ncbi:MAG: CRISPR-associated nuclease/helicase Cas3 [Candidatus Methanolliviera sp. GoM_oil]|nr:MAG: CRISPR-associated nuclease/helicase Cas3 [Candidatus Methanolliviera sp. GoM_oil]
MEQVKTSFLLNDLKSHPNRLLKDHLFNVGKCCKDILSSKKLNIEEYIDSATLQDVAYLIGVTHDFGKATSYFQDYISEKDEKKRAKLKNKPETHHGFVSSIFIYYAIREYLQTKNLIDKKYYEYLPIIGFLVVKRHHGNLHNADDEVIFDEKDDEILEKQIKSVNFGELNKIYGFLLSEINPEINLDCNIIKDKILHSEPVSIYGKQKFQKDYVRELSRKEKKRIRNIDEEHTLLFYFITLLLYSILLDADKTDAANLEKIKRININENIVNEYKEFKFSDEEDKNKKINEMRNKIYEEVLSNVDCINLDKDKILSLNVPTGTGKTLTALSFALKLKNRIESERGYKPRIIYSLPFLSIIDQNFDVFEDVFKTVNKENPTSDILLKHHHLSDIAYTRKEDEFENVDKDIGKDLLLIEGWNSEIIVTTFIQFFHSLISNRNRAIRKIHNITNSIVILDEVQAIPHKYWLLLNRTIKFFAEQFNTYLIFITATQPLIFDETKKEMSPLVENKGKYFNSLNRMKLITNLEPVCLEDFRDILKEDIIQNSDKDFLVVLNTIRSSKDIYDFVTRLNIKNVELYYLSTNIIPKERLIRIKKIKEKSATRSIIVSTQLIEAGVDIDADIVYRDFAPLDSINQVSGRCNRNFGDKQGIVKLFILKEDKDGRAYYPYMIYESFIIKKTKEVFKEIDKSEIEESEFLKLNENYFKKVNIGKSDDESNSILEKVEKLKFSELSDFKLIEKDYPEVDVFIEVDDDAKSVWQEYKEIKSLKDLREREKRFLGVKKEFYDHVISVPGKFKNKVGFDEKMGMGYISRTEIEQELNYNQETGFKREEGGGTLIC